MPRSDIFSGYGDNSFREDPTGLDCFCPDIETEFPIHFGGRSNPYEESSGRLPHLDWGPDDDEGDLYGGDFCLDDPYAFLSRSEQFKIEDEEFRAWDRYCETQEQFQLADEEDHLRFEMAPLRHLKEKRVRRKASHRLTHV